MSQPSKNGSTPKDVQSKWEWYNLSENSVLASFCQDTGLHGLKYLVQPGRHLVERLFWLTAFIASVTTSALLIWGMWKDYTDMPIVTVFNPTKKTLDDIPFPSVTICNVNSVPKSARDKQWRAYSRAFHREFRPYKTTYEESAKAMAKIMDMDFICHTDPSFSQRFDKEYYAANERYRAMRTTINITTERLFSPIATLINVSHPCDEMILRCIWQNVRMDCKELFQEIITDFGYCCTFNTLPPSLLLKFSNAHTKYNAELETGWKDAQLDYENLLFTESTKNRKYPQRQRYPGRSTGLSFQLDPHLNEYSCSSTDSVGFLMGINVPLDYPSVKEKGIAIKTSSEVFIGVRPEIVMSDDSIKDFPVVKRGCYYGNEFKLRYHTTYTATNCMNECIANKTADQCRCGHYNMPRGTEIDLCKPHQYSCAENVTEWIGKNGVTAECTVCLPTCTEIEYHKEVTTLQLWDKTIDFIGNPNISTVHVYFNVDSVYPRLRKEWISMTQLLSNTGGLLGLFLGFSVLSLLEVLYYGTLRPCCNIYREKTAEKRTAKDGEGSSGGTLQKHEIEALIAKQVQVQLENILNVGASIRNVDAGYKAVNDVINQNIENIFRIHNRKNLL